MKGKEPSIVLDPPFEGMSPGVNGDNILPALLRNIENRLSAIINARQEVIEKHIGDFARKAETVLDRMQGHPAVPRMDQFATPRCR